MIRILAILLSTALLGACAGTSETSHRPNRWMEPGSIVGPESVQWDSPARLLRGKSPVYPIEQLLTGKTSSAEVAFTVAEDGSTRDIHVVEAERAVFGRHLAAAIRDWQFEPARKDGVPVASPMTVSFDFTIDRGWGQPPASGADR
ncbi:MAG: TonB family protein [Xanthomonadales bacterium]|nr:TonB family protein [Xanthomonadales bacterium]